MGESEEKAYEIETNNYPHKLGLLELCEIHNYYFVNPLIIKVMRMIM